MEIGVIAAGFSPLVLEILPARKRRPAGWSPRRFWITIFLQSKRSKTYRLDPSTAR